MGGGVTEELRAEVNGKAIRFCKSLYLNHDGAAQRVVRTDNFHGKCRHDSVSLLGTNAAGLAVTWYAVVEAIFKVTLYNVCYQLVYLRQHACAGRPSPPSPAPLRDCGAALHR